MSKDKQEEGFTYIEVMCAMVVLLIGILGQLSALSLCVMRQKESEQQNMARQISSSTLESIFAARDLGKSTGISSWDTINTIDKNSAGIFVPDWNPIRSSAGHDGIQGTRDDACQATAPCQFGGNTNDSPIIPGFQRQIIISDVQDGSQPATKKRIEVKIRYFVGQALREQTTATVISDLPFYK